MSPTDPDSPVPGLPLGEQLGRGTFGAVHRARHPSLDVDVAVKLIGLREVGDGTVRKTLHEARLMARLDHPNLLRVLDAGQTRDAVYLVLEMMDGGSLKGVRSLPPAAALDVTRQLLSGLQALHDARVLHRDIKPANCLRRARDGRVKLADLGIAAEWQTGAGYDQAGTLPYMAPELFDHPPRYSPGTDLYALGMTLACLVLPDDPFPAGPFAAVREWVTSGPRPRVAEHRTDLPAALAALIDRMLARDPRARPAGAAEALAALTGVTAAEPAPPPAAPAAGGGGESTVPGQETVRRSERIGVWVLGERVHESANWLGHVAHHARTGHAARLMHLQPGGPIGGTSAAILAAAERASRLSHPGIAEVVDWGWHGRQAFVVTATQGRSLRDIVDAGHPLDEPDAIRYMAALADALAYLHAAGLVYQLVEPGSAVLRGDARSVQLGWPMFCTPAGTKAVTPEGKGARFYLPMFAPIEAFFGRKTGVIEPSADMYGLGASFYYLLAGAAGYKAVTVDEPLADVRGALRAAVPGLTARFARLLAELLDPDPKARPTAAAARAELGTIARQLGITLAE